MKKWFLPIGAALLLTACGGEENPELEEESQTEVSAPEGDDLDPTDPEAVDEAEVVAASALADGSIPETTPVKISGTVEEMTDNVAFPSYILISEGEQIYIKNISETAIEPGDTIQLEGIYEGNEEENMPLISASVITVE